jgi:hypothetical protein
MNQPQVNVSHKILEKYKVSPADLAWVKSEVADCIENSGLNWTNLTTLMPHMQRSVLSKVEFRFAQRFPSYESEVLEHTVKGRDLSKVDAGGCALIAVVGGVLSVCSLVSGMPFLILLILFVGGWLYMGINSVVESATVPDKLPLNLVARKTEWIRDLKQIVAAEVNRQASSKFFASTTNDPAILKQSVGGVWQPLGPRPIVQSVELTPREAEIYVTAYLKFYGATGVAETRYAKDGGIDVESDLFAGQVKHQQANVGVKAVRELYAVASLKGKKPMFFAKSGFSKDAIEFANKVGMCLFIYLPHLQATNAHARYYIERGMASRIS